MVSPMRGAGPEIVSGTQLSFLPSPVRLFWKFPQGCGFSLHLQWCGCTGKISQWCGCTLSHSRKSPLAPFTPILLSAAAHPKKRISPSHQKRLPSYLSSEYFVSFYFNPHGYLESAYMVTPLEILPPLCPVW